GHQHANGTFSPALRDPITHSIIDPASGHIDSVVNNGEIATLSMDALGKSDSGVFRGYTVGYYRVNLDNSASVAPYINVDMLPPDIIGAAPGGLPLDGNFAVRSISAPAAGDFEGTIATFTDFGDSSNNASKYSAQIDWGDGTT